MIRKITGLAVLLSLTASFALAQTPYVGQVRHAPSINGAVQGSLQQMLAESVTFNGGANVTGDLYVPGTPTVQMNGTPTYGGTLQGNGSTSPSNYTVTLNTGATLSHVVRRTNAITWPSVATVPTPTNNASVTVNSSGQTVNWSTLRDLTLNSGVGQYTVPAGTYGTFSANNNSGFTLGVAGATTPAVYNFQNFNLNSVSKLLVVGPVIVNVANGFSANSTVGASTNPNWLALNIKSGGLNLNSGCNVYGYVLAPGGTVIINNGTQLVGGVTSDYLTVNGGGLLKLQAPQSANQPPTVALTAPANGSTYVAPASITLTATAGDADGSVTKVEFFRGTTKVGEDTTSPYSVTLTGITAGTYSYFARATDNAGATTDSAAVSVTVTNPNQPPTITLTAPADGETFTAPVSVIVSATAADPDGTVSRVDFYQGAILIASDTTAPYSVATSTLSAGTYVLSAKAVDNSGAITASANATITVVNPNQAPTVSITAPADGVSYDDPASFAVNATAADVDGTVIKVGFYRNGVLQAEDATAPYSYAAVGLTPGVYDFVARATDNGGSATDSVPVRVTVAHVNDAPVANAQSVSTNEDTARSITLTATDPDGDALTYSVITQPSSGVLSGTAPNLTYTPAPDFNGTVTFTFKVADTASLQSAPATVTITVVPINDPPVAVPKSLVVPEDGSGQVTLSGLDIDSSSLQFAVSGGPTHGTLSGTLPNLTYTPAPNFHGADAFSYTAFDGEFISAPVQVSITVTAGNVAPAADPAAVATDEDVPVAVVLTGTDADGDPLTYTVASSPAHGLLTGTAPNLTYTPAANYHGPDSFTFTVSDAEFTSAAATVTLTVRPVNDEPIAQSQSRTTVEDTALPLVLSAVEVDVEDSLTYSVVTPPAHGSLGGTAPNLTYTPAANYHGHDSFTFKANDGTADSAPATVNIEVTPFNDRPFAGDLEVNAVEDVPAEFDLPAVDVDGDALTYTVITPPGHGVLSGTAPHLVYTPEANYHGDDGFAYKVSDGSLESAAALVTILVAPVNDAPVGATIAVPLDEDTSAGFVLPGSDVDGDALTYAVVGAPQHGGISGTAPNLTYTPAPNFNGTDSLTYTVADGALTAGPYTVTFAVTPVNDAPVADPKSLLTDEDVPGSVALTGSDIDGDSLTFAIVAPPAHGALNQVSPGTYTYTPAPNHNGSDSFTYVANDASTSSVPATVSISITPVNDAPVAAAQSVVTPEDTTVVITLAGSDVDGDSLTYAISANPAHGTLTPLTANTYSYLPAPDYHGPDAFEFIADDHALQSAPAAVTLDVTPVNDAPVASGQALVTDEDVALSITLAASDVDGDPLTYAVQTPPEHGTLSGSAPNLVYTPAPDYHGGDAFTFTASDGQLTTAPATVTLTINSVNDAPVASGQSVTTAEDTPHAITLVATDVDGDALTYVITTAPAHGSLDGTGATRTYTPAPDYHGPDSFAFMASDGSLSSPDAVVVINVTPVNDAPVASAATYAITTGTPLSLVLAGTDVDGDALTYAVVAQPTHGTLTGTPPNLTYTSAPDFGGFDSLTFKVNDGALDSAPATVQFTTGLPPRSRTYTTTADFTSGSLISVSTDQPDQLANKLVLTSFDAVWIANSSKGTVIKIDPETARVVGEYNAKPVDATAPYPSRIAVDSKGNAWVANMSHNSIIKIGLPENGFWVDRNGNGQIDTSGALGDIRDWDADSVSAADDEAILLYVRTAINGVRHISVDAEDNVWVGGPSGDWQKFDGRTGALLRTETSIGKGGMGGFIANNGRLYSAGTDFLIWPTNDPMAALPQSEEVRAGAWASALDSQGNLWVTKDWTSTVVKYAPDGTKLGEYYHGEPWAMGIAIDANDDVWIAHSHCGHSVGHLLSDGTLLGNVEVTNHGPVELSIDRRGRIWVVSSTGVVDRINPLGGTQIDSHTWVGEVDLTTGNLGGSLWTYGRFTGTGFGLTSPDGFWTFVYDGVLSGSTWGPVVWNALLANDGKVQVEAALSSDGVTYGPFQPLAFGNSTPAGTGRYLKVRTRLVSATSGESPVLYDLSVGTEGYAPPAVPSYWDISAGEDIKGNWPDKIQLKGVFLHTVHDFSVAPTYLWEKVSGPGDVTFKDANAVRTEAQFTAKGDYVLRLTATLGGQVSTSDVKVSLEPYNRAPYANAGYTTFRADLPPEIWLWGEIRDDGLPNGAPVTSSWEKLFGPGTVTFTDPASPTTKASFSAPGVYVLRLNATDTALTGSDVTTVWLGYACIPVAPSGLMSWWQASGNGDDHVGGNQAFTSGGADYAEGKIGGAFRFDGVNDRVRIFSAPSLDTGVGEGFTVELWVNPDTSRTATILEYSAGSQRGFNLRQVGTQLEADFRSASGTSHVLAVGGVLPTGTWTHVTASYDQASGEARVYINGIVRATQAIGSFVLGTNLDVNFGGRPSSVESFDGLLDEISIYNRALYADEVTTIVSHPAGKRPPVSNVAPAVDAGPTLYNKTANTPVTLNGVVTDDGQPIDGVLTSLWSVVSGPGIVSFADPAAPQTTAIFSESGVYLLELRADDGGFCARSTVEVRVDALHKVESDATIAAWWPFNQDTVDVIHGHRIERANGTSLVPDGKVSQGLSFDGINNFGTTPAHGDVDLGASAAGFTIEFWVKPTQNRDGTIFSWGTFGGAVGVDLYQYAGGREIEVNLRDRTTGADAGYRTVGTALTAGEWTHYALTLDRVAGEIRLYVNGVQNQLFTGVGNRAVRTQFGLTFGRHAWDTAHPWMGTLDELTFYKRPLSYAELNAIYSAGAIGKSPFDNNAPPTVSAGSDKVIAGISLPAVLDGQVTDDGRPAGGSLAISWSKQDGPGTVTFANQFSAATTATFSAPGLYVLRLDANDGLNQAASDTMIVSVGIDYGAEPQPIPPLSAWWPGDAHPREVVHGGHDVTLINGAGYASGKVSEGFLFDGNNDYGTVPAHADLDPGASAAGFTIEFWVKPTQNRDGTIFSWGNFNGAVGVDVYQYAGGREIEVNLRDRTTGADAGYRTVGTAMTAGQWTHYALTLDRVAGEIRLYVNGVQNQLFTGVGNRAVRTQFGLTFGRHAWDTGHPWMGVLDELTFYNRPLTQPEIGAIVAADSDGKTPLDDNLPPVVSAGPDSVLADIGSSATLPGSVLDDGKPFGPATIQWTKEDGPGTVNFADTTSAATTATFSAPGLYLLKLTAHDAYTQPVSDLVQVRVGTTNAAEPSAGLAVWWPGDAHPREVVQGGHDVTLINGAGYAPGKVSEGFAFDGDNDYGTIPAHGDLDPGASAAGFTIEFWVKPTQNRDGTIFSWGNFNGAVGVDVYQYAGGREIEVNLRDRTTGADAGYRTSGSALTAGQWTHYALTLDRVAGEVRLYVNGVQNQLYTGVGNRAVRTQFGLTFGRHAWDLVHSWMGVLDELTFYNRPLTQPEIRAIVAAGSDGKSPPDDNLPPVVSAGPDAVLPDIGSSATLAGSVLDDGKPFGPATIQWTKENGPGTVSFADSASAATTATFSAPGLYLLKLTAQEAYTQPVSDLVQVRVGTTNAAEPSAGLAVWWPGDAHPREVVQGGHDVTLINGAGYAPGKVSEGFVFDGGDDYGTIPAHEDLDPGASAAGFTIEFWVKPTQNRDGTIFSWGNFNGAVGVDVYQYAGGREIEVNLRDRTTGADAGYRTSGSALTAGQWTHYALTLDRVAGEVRLYVNGVQNQLYTGVGNRAVRTQFGLTFGRHAWDLVHSWMGVLDELTFYNRPLTQPEIAAIVAAGTDGKTPPDDNLPPVVSAGPDAVLPDIGSSATLAGSVLDDGKPFGPATIQWTKEDGPGTVAFVDANAAATTATFSAPGLYLLKLTAHDAYTQPVSDIVQVRVGTTSAVAPPTGIAVWWPGDAHPREVVQGGHDVTLINGAGYAPGKVSEGFVFDGGDDYGTIPAHEDLDPGASAAGFTIEFWVKPTQNRDGTIFSWGNFNGAVGVDVYQYAGGREIEVNLRDRTTGADAGYRTSGSALTAGQWTHYALTLDRVAGEVRLYVNGVQNQLYTGVGNRAVRTQFGLTLGRHAWDLVHAWMGVLDELTFYNRPLSQLEIGAIVTAGTDGKIPPAGNTLPTVLLDAPASNSAVSIDTPLTLSSLAEDTDGTIAKVEFFDGATTLGETTTADSGQPSRFSFAVPGALSLGQHVLTARATDNLGALTTSAPVTIQVVPVLPVVALTSPAGGSVLTTGVPLTVTATATYSLGAVTKVEFYDGAAKLGEATTPSSPDTFTVTVPAGLSAGAHTLSAKVTAGGVSATSALVNVTSQVVVPVIAITSPANASTIVAAVPIALKATATTAQGTITKVEFFEGTTKLGERLAPDAVGGSVYTFTLTAGFPAGAHSLTAKATSSTAATATSAAVSITAGTYTAAPVVEISTPAEDARISAPTPVTGVVGIPSLTSWVLDYRLKAADGDPAEPWVQFATGSSLVGTPETSSSAAIPGSLGTFDPTLLLNGIYEIRLRATNASLATYTAGPITVVVEGNMKVGAFTLAFEDLKVPVAGVPITITRTYDSRDARVGDFGPGWRLAVANIRVQKNRNLGAAWWQTPQSGTGIQFYYVESLSDRIVTVTMPDGESHRFRAGAYVKKRPGDPDNASFAVVNFDGRFKFYPLGDTTSTLEPVDAAGVLDDHFYIHGTGDQDLRTEDQSDPFSPTYDPTRFRLTTKDGAKYLLDERLGLLRLEDLNGNTLVLNRDGQNKVTSVVSTLNTQPAPVSSTITIHRDGTGRVDYIRDLAGRDLDYLYDSQGRLASFTNRELNVTQFRYENPAFPHYLTKVIDPRGISALRSEFDADGRLIKQIDADGKETVFDRGINTTGRFEKITDRLGHATTLYYDDRGNVTTKIDALGAQTTYGYYADSDRVKFETDHYGNTKSMAYDERGNVTVETMGASLAEDPASPATGYTTRTVYNAISAPTQITDPAGRVQGFSYDPVTNNLLTHTLGAGGPAPATTVYHYNADGTLDTITDALGNVTSHAYNYAFTDPAYPAAVKQVTVTVTDPAGAAGSDPGNTPATILRVSKTIYDAQENMLATVATRTIPGAGAEEVVTRYLYDRENRLKATVMPDGKVNETRFTSFGQTDRTLLWKSLADYQSGNDALARVTSYGYDNRGNEVSTSYPDGSSESSSFDFEGRSEWSQDKLGRRTTFQYDDTGRLRFTFLPDATPGTLADNPYTETVYDLAGRVTDTYDELRHRTSVAYFPDGTPDAGRRRQSVQVLGTGNLATTYAYDASGNVRFVTDPRGNTVETQYDDRGQPTAVVYPATDEHPATQSVTKYNALGQRTEIADQEGKVMRYRYDGLGRLTEIRQYLDSAVAASDAGSQLPATHPAVVLTSYTYDELGNQLTQTDARANTTSYRYDSLGRRTTRILPDNATEFLQYDEWGNLWKRTDFKGYTTTFLYDTLDRLTEKRADPSHPSLIYSHAPDRISYGYDAAGNRTDALMEKGSTVLYAEDTPVDERGRRQFKSTALGKLTYDYYANSLLKGITSSNPDGVKLGYRYDDANRLAYVDDSSSGTAKTTGYTYNANGSLATVTTPNTVVHTYSYDALNRLRTLNVAKGAVTLHGYEYKLKASGQRRQVIEGAKTTTYTYDELYRLTNEAVTGDTHGNNGSVGYTLDKVGNRESRASSIAAVAAAGNTFNSRDWLSGDSYDANGNTTLSLAFNAQPDVYDFEDRLIIRQKLDGSTVNLSYDADGLLRQKTVFNSSLTLVSATGYLQDASNPTGYAQIMEERINTSAGTTVKTYAYGSDLISQSTLAAGSALPVLRYYSYDGLGSVRELTNESGNSTDVFDYDAFGILVHRAGTTDNAYLYRGERFESDIGQYYLRARFYNQGTGRFWNQDTYEGSAGDPVSLHKYLYANAGPINASDPSGHTSLTDLNMAQGAMGNLFKMANVTLKIMRAVDKATTALETVGLVRDLTLFFMNPAGSALGSALEILKSAAGIDHSFARFLTLDGLRDAFDALASNAGKIALGIGTHGLLPQITGILAKPNSDVVLYMPTPFTAGPGITIPPIKTGVRFKGRDVVLYFGKSSKGKDISKVGGGRVFGLGVTDPSRSFPFQIFRMDWHEKHAPGTYDWSDGDYHFHMGKINQ